MSVLIVHLPARPRLAAQAASAAQSAEAGAAAGVSGVELAWATTEDGLSLLDHGRSSATRLPGADAVVAVIGPEDVAWQRLTVPQAPAGKMRPALAGLLEDELLDAPEDVHVALAPDAVPGQPSWIAVTDRAWLSAELARLERAGTAVDRVVPALWPGDLPRGYFFNAAAPHESPRAALALADANGIVHAPLAGTLSRRLVPPESAQVARWTAEPAVAAEAEAWLGGAVEVQTEADRLLWAARSLWNLRQFELAPRRRGTRAAMDAWKRFLAPGWRPVRWALVALAAVHVVGLNAWAWAQRQALEDKKREQQTLLTRTFPQVRAVVDAPAQMKRETDLLRMAAGAPGETDLEPMLDRLSRAWPEGKGPVQSLRFEPGLLSFAAAGWSDDDAQRLRDRLRPAGWAVEQGAGRITVRVERRAGG